MSELENTMQGDGGQEDTPLKRVRGSNPVQPFTSSDPDAAGDPDSQGYVTVTENDQTCQDLTKVYHAQESSSITVRSLWSWTNVIQNGDQPNFTAQIGQDLGQIQIILSRAVEEDSLQVEVENATQRPYVLNFWLCFLDKHGQYFAKIEQEDIIEPGCHQIELNENISWALIMSEPDSYLPNENLTMFCQIRFEETEFMTLQKPIGLQNLCEDSNLDHLERDLLSLKSNNDAFSDVTLASGMKSFKCHKIVLAARSDVFNAMFTVEKLTGTEKSEYNFNHYSPEVLDQFLSYIYGNRLYSYNSISLLIIADNYNVKGLKINCQKSLARNMTEANCLDCLTVAFQTKSSYLLEKASKFILQHLKTLVGSTRWIKMVQEIPQAMGAILACQATMDF